MIPQFDEALYNLVTKYLDLEYSDDDIIHSLEAAILTLKTDQSDEPKEA